MMMVAKRLVGWLFPRTQIRALVEERERQIEIARRLTERLAEMQAKLSAVRAENERLVALNERYLGEALKASQATANWMARSLGKAGVYDGVGPAEPAPSPADSQPLPPTRMTARAAVEMQKRQFLEQLNQFTPPPAPEPPGTGVMGAEIVSSTQEG